MHIPTSVIRAASKAAATVKKYSPQIMMAIGVVTSVGAVVEAVKQTPKAMDTLEDHRAELTNYKVALENDDTYELSEYKKDLAKLYIRTGSELGKIYLMPVLMEATSLLCFFNAHRIMNNRNKQLAAALATMTDAYNSYRNKVIEAIGEEKEEKIRLGLGEEKEVKEIIDETTGKKRKITSVVDTFDEDTDQLGPWDFLWGENDYNFDQSEKINMTTLSNIAGTYSRALYDPDTNFKEKISIASMIKDRLISEDDLYEKYPNFVINGYTQKNKDRAVVIATRPVKIYKTVDGIRTFRYGYILTFNGDGPVVV